jgi:hypothetical protein
MKGTCYCFLTEEEIEVRLARQKKMVRLVLISSRRQLGVEKGLISWPD